MDFWRQVDQYCERTDASFWSEPINFLTNLAFLIAAFMIWRQIRQRHLSHDPVLRTLTVFLFLIGVGSGIFHSVATVWAEFADVLPISIFVLVFLYFWPRQIIGLSLAKNWLVFLSFFVCSGLMMALFSGIDVGGSQGYFGVILYLIAFAIHQKWKRPNSGTAWLAIAALVFAVSLFFRTIDLWICNFLPLGTHFIWHCLNAVVCYLSVYALLEAKEFQQQSS